jgi:outer membrane lipoprotein-sorting protein
MRRVEGRMAPVKASAWLWIAVSGLMLLHAAGAAGQTNCNEGAGTLKSDQPQGISVADIITKFSAHESEFKEAQTHYTYTQEVLVQTLSGKAVDGEYRHVSKISYSQGKRVENVELAPQSTLQRVVMTREDFEDIEHSPFDLTTEDLAQYNVTYAGQQKVDMLDTYVFDVSPKQIQKGRRYFQGRVWVENQDFALVKSCGKNVPEDPEGKKKKRKKGQPANVEPTMVTYREQFEHRYWFPVYRRSDVTVDPGYASEVHVREVIKYTQYQRADASPGAVSTSRP